MDTTALLINCLWAGLFSSCLGILLTAPPRYSATSFLCGFAGRLVRDLCIVWGMSLNWSTAAAALVVVLVGVAIIQRHEVSPVVLISGVLPLGAAVAMFNAVVGLMKVSSYQGIALNEASVMLNASVGKVFTISLAIAVGLGAGMAVVRFCRHEKVWE